MERRVEEEHVTNEAGGNDVLEVANVDAEVEVQEKKSGRERRTQERLRQLAIRDTVKK